VESFLLVVPPDPDVRVPADIMVAGLPLLRRIVLAGMRAGFSRVLVPEGAGDGAMLDGTTATPLTTDARPTSESHRVVILPGNVVPQVAWLRALREATLPAERLHVDASMTAVIDTTDSAPVLAAAARIRHAGDLVAGLRARFGWSNLDVADTGRFPLSAPGDAAAAESWLLRSLIKQREGFMSRHFERKVSLALTRRLAPTRVTPDMMTLVSLAIGLSGSLFFLSSSAAYQLIGALLFLTHSILDGCDGELARLKFMESPRGAILDFWGDNLVHAAVFASMAIGLSVAQDAAWPLALGALAVVGTFGSAASMSRQIMGDTVLGGDASWTARFAEAFTHRDFIYLVLVLSALGKAHWVLILASAGTPIFFLLFLWVGARRRA
jgi:phosphatidylglycerophosphate synthase